MVVIFDDNIVLGLDYLGDDFVSGRYVKCLVRSRDIGIMIGVVFV